MIIESIDDPRLSPFRNVRDKDLKREDGLFLGEGPLTVDKMLSLEGVTKSVLVAKRWAERYLPQANDEVEVLVASKDVMSAVLGFSFHRGVIGAGYRAPFENRQLQDILPPQVDSATILLIEGVGNVDNIGLLFRNAAAFACDAVVMSSDCCDPLYRKSLRVSLGHVLSTPWCVSANLAETIKSLKEQEINTVAAALTENALSLNDFTSPNRVALLMGQERNGISATLLEAVDAVVKIPMAPGVDSLNVAAASAVCLHQLSQGKRQ